MAAVLEQISGWNWQRKPCICDQVCIPKIAGRCKGSSRDRRTAFHNRGLREGKEYPHRRIWENAWDRKCVSPEHRKFAYHYRNTTCAYPRILQEARVQWAIFGDTEQIEKRDWKCKECARQTKGCKSRSSKKTNLLAGLRLPTFDKSFEKLEGNQPHCERHG